MNLHNVSYPDHAIENWQLAKEREFYFIYLFIYFFLFSLQNLIRFKFLVLSGASYLHKFCYSSVIGNRPIAVLPGVYTSTQPTVRKSVFRDIEGSLFMRGA